MTAATLLLLLPALAPADVSGHVELVNGRAGALAAVWLEGEARAKPLAKAMIDQRDREFIPHVLIVTVGTKVDFPNNDTVLHNVFADYNAKVFDLGAYPRGVSKPKIFDKKGLVVLQCNMHSEMGAFIIVVDTPFYKVADSKGNFVIKDVPAGKYTLHAWHESNQVLEQELEVTGDVKDLNLTLKRRKR
jgi:plastocyanin